jgi:hypothetical protein
MALLQPSGCLRSGLYGCAEMKNPQENFTLKSKPGPRLRAELAREVASLIGNNPTSPIGDRDVNRAGI